MPEFPEGPPNPLPTHCAHCGEIGSGESGLCLKCARLVAGAEIEHIAYLLRQLPGWRAEGLLSAVGEERLHARYIARQAVLHRSEGAGSGFSVSPHAPDGATETASVTKAGPAIPSRQAGPVEAAGSVTAGSSGVPRLL